MRFIFFIIYFLAMNIGLGYMIKEWSEESRMILSMLLAYVTVDLIKSNN